MDEIQKVLIKCGRRDLAQKYYLKVSANSQLVDKPIAQGQGFQVFKMTKPGEYLNVTPNAQFKSNTWGIDDLKETNISDGTIYLITNNDSPSGIIQFDTAKMTYTDESNALEYDNRNINEILEKIWPNFTPLLKQMYKKFPNLMNPYETDSNN